MLKYMKENKVLVAAVILFLILIGVSFIVKEVFFSGTSNASYGDRLDGIEDVKITSDLKKDVVSNLEGDSAVKSAKCLVQGKIVNIIITVNDDVGVDTAKSLSGKAIEKFGDDKKAFYDFQIFVKKESDATDFPIIGYKQNKRNDFVWTKDRAAS